ncbi:P-II family nitrogen regulator [Rheinheimera gaetbuli]
MKHSAYQVNILAEKILEEDIIAMLDEEGAKGYTVLEAGGNSALHLHPAQHASLMDALHIMKIEVIVREPAKAEHIAERLMDEFFSDQPGIVTLSEVWVYRTQKF